MYPDDKPADSTTKKDEQIDLTAEAEPAGQDNEAERVEDGKRKNVSQNDSRTTKKPKTSTVVWGKRTKGFRISRRVTLQNCRYIHLCTVFNEPHHSWSVVTYQNKTWIGGKENLGGMNLYGDEEFVTQERFMETDSNPCLHAYVLEEKEADANELATDDSLSPSER